jgi:3-methylfumaryl-CoA hydratase
VFVLVRHEIAVSGESRSSKSTTSSHRGEPQPGSGRRRDVPHPATPPGRARSIPTTCCCSDIPRLTFNGHRIHYDRRYVTEVEGYPGLVVHGPLIATLLVDLLRRNRPAATIARFVFRAMSRSSTWRAFSVNGKPEDGATRVSLWAANAAGELAMDATANLA